MGWMKQLLFSAVFIEAALGLKIKYGYTDSELDAFIEDTTWLHSQGEIHRWR